LVNERCRVVVFGTRLIKIHIIEKKKNGPLFLTYWNDVRNPLIQGDRINKTILQQFSTSAFMATIFLG
jgi:hypothetical protein